MASLTWTYNALPTDLHLFRSHDGRIVGYAEVGLTQRYRLTPGAADAVYGNGTLQALALRFATCQQ